MIIFDIKFSESVAHFWKKNCSLQLTAFFVSFSNSYRAESIFIAQLARKSCPLFIQEEISRAVSDVQL